MGVSNSQISTSVVTNRGQVWGVGVEDSGGNSQVSTSVVANRWQGYRVGVEESVGK